ncbi:MAG: hypothetical protein R3F54_18510 [Alphaproteobacteria bacterium]
MELDRFPGFAIGKHMGSKKVYFQQSPDPSDAMLEAMKELWQLSPPRPDDMLSVPAFQRLCEVCRDSYPNIGEGNISGFVLSTALDALGLPCNFRADTKHLASPVEDAFNQLDAAIRATHAQRLHFAPMDMAADFPPISFGSARVGRFTPDKLNVMIDATRLNRMLPRADFDAHRFSEFSWLVVEENVELDSEPEKRHFPALFMDVPKDLGRIEPHKRRFPDAVEDALFFMLLAP